MNQSEISARQCHYEAAWGPQLVDKTMKPFRKIWSIKYFNDCYNYSIAEWNCLRNEEMNEVNQWTQGSNGIEWANEF